MEIALYLVIGLMLGCVLTFVILRNQILNLKQEKLQKEVRLEQLLQEKQEALTAAEVALAEKRHSEKQVENVERAYKERLQLNEEAHKEKVEEIKSSAREQQEKLEKTLKEQMAQQVELIKEQMNTTSEKILKERSEELSSLNQQNLTTILNPLNDHIKLMKEAVEKSDREHAETMVRLDATIKNSVELSKQVGERADKLAQALTGENKTQGNFGELRLRQLLEGMGLEEGVQFEEQTAMRDASGNLIREEEQGRTMIPDVILHFPEHRDLIIDSKVSLKAYEDYYNADNEEEKAASLKRHLTSVKSHVMELSKKNYNRYIQEGHERLDFVILYMFSENALQLALSQEAGLWKWAYDMKVIITGSQNLFPMLRVLELSWNQVRQVENQHEIMEAANLIVDRVQMFVERFEEVDKHLEATRKSFDEVKTICADSGKSIPVAANKLLKYGAQENPKRKKSLPKLEI